MEHMLSVDGCTLHHRIDGQPEAPPVLLSHGATLDGASWAAQIPVLAQHYRVISWDMRGHGRSLPLHGNLTFGRCAEDMRALLDHLGIERCGFVGLSLGSFVSQEFGFRYPSRVRALASIGATSLTGLRMSWVMRFAMRHSGRIMRLLPFSLLVWITANGAAIRPEVQDYIRRTVSKMDKDRYLAIWSAVQTGLRDAPDYHEPFPLMIAVGSQDNVGVTRKGAFAWQEARPKATFHVIPEAGHCANQDNPKETNRILLEFLARAAN